MQPFMNMPNPEFMARLSLAAGDDLRRLNEYAHYANYYDGVHLEQIPSKNRNRLERYLDFRANLCDVIVDALAERLQVTGFEVSSDPEGGESEADEKAESRLQQVWQRNRMDEDSGTAHHEAAKLGDSFVIVDWDNRRKLPRISYNPASCMMVRYSDPSNKTLDHAVKTWDSADLKIRRRNVYFENRVERSYQQVSKAGQYGAEWLPWADEDGGPIIPWVDSFGQPLGCPVFHFRNKAKGNPYGRSELLNVIALQDAINKTLVDLLIVLDRQGWPQMWAKGKKPPEGWQVGPGIVWSSESPDFEAGAIPAADPASMLAVLSQLINTTAGRSRTPQHLFHIDGAYPSGEALKTAESGLAGKVRDRQIAFGNVWEDVALLALRLDNAFGGAKWAVDDMTITTDWKDAEMRNDLSEAQRVSTLAPWLPLPAIWREMGKTDAEQEILQREWDAEQERKDTLGGSLLDAFRTGGQAPPLDDSAGTPGSEGTAPNTKPGGQGMTRNPDRQP